MRLDMDKAVLCLSLLTEGSSIRSTERITGIHRDTICSLLRVAGAKCEALLNRLVRHVPVADVQADELWCFVGMKERTKKIKKNSDPEMGDAYTFVGIERDSKLALAHHMGRRTSEDASIFAAKLAAATTGQFQISTDGFNGYPGAIEEHLGDGWTTACWSRPTALKRWTLSAGTHRRAIIWRRRSSSLAPGGGADLHLARRADEPAHPHVHAALHPPDERFQPEAGQPARRAGAPLRGLQFTWMHSGIRMTPAMKAGIARKPWTVRDLLTA